MEYIARHYNMDLPHLQNVQFSPARNALACEAGGSLSNLESLAHCVETPGVAFNAIVPRMHIKSRQGRLEPLSAVPAQAGWNCKPEKSKSRSPPLVS